MTYAQAFVSAITFDLIKSHCSQLRKCILLATASAVSELVLSYIHFAFSHFTLNGKYCTNLVFSISLFFYP